MLCLCYIAHAVSIAQDHNIDRPALIGILYIIITYYSNYTCITEYIYFIQYVIYILIYNIYIKMHTAKGEESNQNNNTVMKRFLSVLPIFAIFIAVVKGIYPNDHFKYSTKLTEENVDLFVKSNVDNGKTIFIRTIASPG